LSETQNKRFATIAVASFAVQEYIPSLVGVTDEKGLLSWNPLLRKNIFFLPVSNCYGGDIDAYNMVP
jgi:hypothetical protein